MENIELLKLDRVSYESTKHSALKGITLSLRKEENIAVFGSEDSGVEIICPVIAGLINNFKGEIYYKGRSIKSFDYLETHKYRKEIGYLQRDYGLINNMTAAENISLPLKYHSNLSGRQIDELVDKYINKMHLSHCRDLRPVNLARSEQLKTAFIRAITLNPELMLIEHPLEGNCQINIQTFINSFKEESFSAGRSIIFVTYNPNTYLEFADRYIMLYNGEIVFQGSKDEFLFSDNEYLKQYRISSTEGPMKIM